MTTEEIKEACKKFVDYLSDNGVSVKSHMLIADGLVAGYGDHAALLYEAMKQK